MERTGLFILNAGIIRLAMGASLDYNIKDHHVLEVWALDGGGLKSKTAAIVNISVVDVNNKVLYFQYYTLKLFLKGVENFIHSF